MLRDSDVFLQPFGKLWLSPMDNPVHPLGDHHD
jgi:hypothetical protein